MKIVALVRPPARLEEAVAALSCAAGITQAEARMRLAPEPPSLLARLEPHAADALVEALRAAGLAALAVDVRCPTEKDRVPVARFSLADDGATFSTRAGETVGIGWPEVIATLRALRAARTQTERTETSRKLSVGTALATGGLSMTRKTTTTVRSSSESTEQVILVHLGDGRALSLAEHELEFSCLGPAMQPSSTANMVELATRLRARTPRAFHDDRLLRLGRRPLPFALGSDARTATSVTVVTRSDSGSALDLLAEVMRRALVEGLLP